MARPVEHSFPIRSPLIATLVCCQVFAAAVSARAQSTSPGGDRSASSLRNAEVSTNYGQYQNLIVTVLNSTKAHLDRQAVIALHDLKRESTVWQATSSESQAIFYDLDFGDYDVEVSALGYETEHKHVQVSFAIKSPRVEVILGKDPTAVELSLSDDLMPPKQRKEVARAVYALRSSNLKEAQKRLDKIYKYAPSSAQLNFLYGYLYFLQKNLDQAGSYLSRAASLDPRRAETLVLLGRVQLMRNQYDDARKTLEQAVANNPANWMAHNLLSEAYLKEKENEKARDQAQLAIDEGKSAASGAQIILGEALANLGREQEALQVLRTFVKNNPNDPMTAQVQGLIGQIEGFESNARQGEKVQLAVDFANSTPEPVLPLSAWGPPGVDDVKPSVATDVACPYQQVVQMSGERVKQLVDDVSNFAATEDLFHEQLDQFGTPVTKEDRKFDYVAAIAEGPPGYFDVNENRNTRYGIDDLPDRIVTSGFMSLALIFHPDLRDDFQVTCEGLGQWQGQATWLMYFRQRDDKPSRLESYKVGTQNYPVNMKGRAWIRADNFEIVRMESDLLSPVPRLTRQHQIVEYGPVHFKKKDIDLWLPERVELYLELNRHRYYRRHSFDHYMLFSVNAEDKLPVLKAQEKVKNSSTQETSGEKQQPPTSSDCSQAACGAPK